MWYTDINAMMEFALCFAYTEMTDVLCMAESGLTRIESGVSLTSSGAEIK